MDQQLMDLLVNGGGHALPIVAVIWLAFENRRLQKKLEEVRLMQASVINLTLNHGQKLDGIEKKAMRRINDRITNEPGAYEGKE